MKTYKDLIIDDIETVKYNYQEKLTDFLDNYDDDFSQELIDKIILWKINRYAFVPKETLNKINKIKRSDEKIDIPLTKEILNDCDQVIALNEKENDLEIYNLKNEKLEIEKHLIKLEQWK